MLSALVWISGSYAKSVPVKQELSDEQLAELQQVDEDASTSEQDFEQSNSDQPDLDEELKDLNLDTYDDEKVSLHGTLLSVLPIICIRVRERVRACQLSDRFQFQLY